MALAESQSKVLLVVTVLLLIWTTLFATLRFWAKWSQNKLSWVDGVFAVAYTVGVAQSSTVFVATTQYGFGPRKRTPTDLAKTFYAGELLYIISVGLTRCTTALFLSGLSKQKPQRLSGTGLAVISAAWTVAGVVAIAVRDDISAPWTMPSPPFVRWIGVESAGLAVELALWVFAFLLVWGLNMPVLRRLKLIFIFGSRLAIIPLVALRLIRLSPSTFHNTTYDITMVCVFTEAVMNFALIAECLTCLKPFLQTFHEGFAPGNAPHYWGDLSQSQGHSGNRSGDGLKRSKTGMVVWQKETPTWKRYSSRRMHNDDMDLRTDVSGFSTKIEGRRGVRAEDDMELLPVSNNIRVQKNITMSVSN